MNDEQDIMWGLPFSLQRAIRKSNIFNSKRRSLRRSIDKRIDFEIIIQLEKSSTRQSGEEGAYVKVVK